MRQRSSLASPRVPHLVLAVFAALVSCLPAWAEEPGSAEASPLPAPISEALRYLPPNCTICGWIDLTACPKGSLWAATQTPPLLNPAHVDRLVFGATGVPFLSINDQLITNGSFVVSVNLKLPLSSDEIRAGLPLNQPGNWREETVSGTLLYMRESAIPLAYCLPGEKTLLYGTPEVLREVLERQGPAVLPEPLAQACQRLNAAQPIALAIAPPTFLQAPLLKESLPEVLCQGLEAILLEADFVGGLHARLSLLCADEPTSYQLLGMLELGHKPLVLWAQQAVVSPPVMQSLASLHTAVEDGCVRLEGTVPLEVLQGSSAGVASTALGAGPLSLPSPPPTAVSGAPVPYASGSAIRPDVPGGTAPITLAPLRLGEGTTAPPASYGFAQASSSAPVASDSTASSSTSVPVTNLPAPPATTFLAPAVPTTQPYPHDLSRAGTPAYVPNPYVTPQYPSARSEADLAARYAELQQRLRRIEQDRDLLAERVKLYLRQLDSYRRELAPEPENRPR